MTKAKLFAAMLMASSMLAACGGGGSSSSNSSGSSSSSSSSSSGGDCGVLGCVDDPVVTELDISNQEFPLIERFETSAAAGTNEAEYFFSPEYKTLNSANPQTLPDGTVHEDPFPAFYYATAGLWDVDEVTGEQVISEDVDYSLLVGDGYLALSNARFTIGQLLPDVVTAADSEEGDAKNKTSNAPVSSSWGELDLSQPYRVSFCLKDSGLAGAGSGGNLELYVDNNSGGNQGQSIHGDQSKLLGTAAANLIPGNRLVIDVPGSAQQVDANGETLGLISATADVFGTEHSYLQLRVSSGGYAVISDLVIEHQNENGDYVNYLPCEAAEGLYEQAPPPSVKGQMFTELPLNVDFSVGRDEFFGGEDAAGDFLAISDAPTKPFYTALSSASRIFIEGEGDAAVMRFGNAYWAAGYIPGTEENPAPTGDMDLSYDYSITIEIDEVPTFKKVDGDGFQVQIDNATSSADTGPHGAASRLVEILPSDGLETGTLVINVPGAVTMNGEPVTVTSTDETTGVTTTEPLVIEEHLGTESSFLMFRCPGNCDNAAEGEGGIVVSSIVVDYQGEGPGETAWAGQALPLLGEPGVAPSGSIAENTESSVTLTATGGKVNSSNHAFFFAHQQIDMSDFAITAQVTAIDAPESGGDGYRFGMMVTTSLEYAEVYADLGAYAELSFYVDGDGGALTGSRITLKDGGSRSRSDVGEPLAVGDWIRMEVADDGEDKRVTWWISHDNGSTWIKENSKSGADFAATAADDAWYVGFFGAPGDADVTMEFDNISITPVTAE